MPRPRAVFGARVGLGSGAWLGTCTGSGVWLGFGFRARAGLGRVFGSGAERMLAVAQRTPTGAERAPDAGLGSGAGRVLTGASMTLRPTGQRDPCSRSRGPTTWRSKASYGAGGGAPEHPGQWWGAQCPSRTAGGSASAQSCQRSPRLSIHHPAGSTEQRTCDHAARRRMVAPTRRSPPASGKRPTSIAMVVARLQPGMKVAA